MRGIEIQVLPLNDLSRSKVECLLERSLNGEHKVMDDFTFCLFDISEYEIEEWRSILIQKNGDMYRSFRTTNQLLEDYADEFYHIHERTCLVASVLGYHQKVPYVIGERCIIPLDGYSKKPVTWIVANHAVRVTYNRLNNVLHLTSRRNMVLEFSIARTVFEEQISRSVDIMKYKLALHKGQVKEYQCFYREPRIRVHSILSVPFEQSSFKTPDLTYFDVEMKVRDYLEKKRVKLALGEDSPSYDDYLKQTS